MKINFRSIKKNKTTLQKVETALAIFIINCIWMAAIFKLLVVISHEPVKTPLPVGLNPEDGPASWQFMTDVILAPIVEEFLFRLVPIMIAMRIDRGKYLNQFVILSCIVWAWMHPGGYETMLKQGIAGLALSYLYIKNGYSLKSTISVHMAWNFCLGWVFPFFI